MVVFIGSDSKINKINTGGGCFVNSLTAKRIDKKSLTGINQSL